jgi:hypothetical protein
MEKLYIDLSEPLGSKKTNINNRKIFGLFFIALSSIGIILNLYHQEYGYFLLWMIIYLICGFVWVFQEKIPYFGNNFVSLDSEMIAFKLGLTMKKKQILWKDLKKVTINVTSVLINYIGGEESLKIDWILYKDVKELKNAIRNICRENNITLNEN